MDLKKKKRIKTAASTSPKGILVVKFSCPISAMPFSLSLIYLIVLTGPFPLSSGNLFSSFLLLISLTASHHLYPAFLKHDSIQKLTLPPVFLLNAECPSY